MIMSYITLWSSHHITWKN